MSESEKDSAIRLLLQALAWAARLVAVALILVAGVLVMKRLEAMRQPPARRAPVEPEQVVAAMTVRHGSEPVTLSGYGTVTLARVLPLSPEVGGRVRQIHPQLRPGVTLEANELILTLDDRDLRLEAARLEADLARLAAEVAVLEADLAQRRTLLPPREASLALAEAELARSQALRAAGNLATQSEVDATRRRVLQEQEGLLALRAELAVLPPRVAAVQAARGALEQGLARVRLDLMRCTLRAPFTGRVQRVAVELDQMLRPGEVVLELADDASREVLVSLPASQVTRWLRFTNGAAAESGWFHHLEQVPAEIRWVDAPAGSAAWPGLLTRVADYDDRTRTLRVVAQVRPALQPPYPLVAGMFCEVRLPGRALPRAVAVPRQALQAGDTVFLMVDGRLAQRAVTVAHLDGERALITEGLVDGELLVTGKLLSPVLGMKLRQPGTPPSPPAPDAPAPEPDAAPAGAARPPTTPPPAATTAGKPAAPGTPPAASRPN